jgi:tyrosyl-tRNA synthetase
MGLDENAAEDAEISSKMSKSKPASGILIHDDEKTIRDKIIKAFCPMGVAEGNPVLELVRYVVFHQFKDFVIERPAKYGGSVMYSSYKDVESDSIRQGFPPHIAQPSVAYLYRDLAILTLSGSRCHDQGWLKPPSPRTSLPVT